MKLIINGKARKIIYNKTDKYYYNSKDGKVDASKYFLKGDKVSSLNEGSLKKQYRKMLVGGGPPLDTASINALLKSADVDFNNKTDISNKIKELESKIQELKPQKKKEVTNITDNYTIECYQTELEKKKESLQDKLIYLNEEPEEEEEEEEELTGHRGGSTPKKDLKTFLSKLRILIKEFE